MEGVDLVDVLRVDTVFLFVSDLERSRAFYQQLLGVEPTHHRDGMMAQFEVGETHLRLHSDASATWLPAGATKGVGLGLHLGVTGIDDQWRRLQALGVPVPEEPTTLHTGIRKFALKDPDGYQVELVEPPAGGASGH